MKTLLFLFTILSAAAVSAAPTCKTESKLNSKLTCKLFINALPEADLEIHITGTSPTQESREVQTKSGKFRAEISWDGYWENYPRNPEMRIQAFANNDSVSMEAYKNFDLHRYEKQGSVSESDDNIGIRTSNDVVYLSCNYTRLGAAPCGR